MEKKIEELLNLLETKVSEATARAVISCVAKNIEDTASLIEFIHIHPRFNEHEVLTEAFWLYHNRKGDLGDYEDLLEYK